MCGIFGIVDSSGRAIDQARVRAGATLMRHRGPDAYGQWGIPGKVEFAHLRLSIIDLSPESNQPFLSACGRYAIVFNGEIYNYIEIRQELRSRGYEFRTSSDTEVLLNSYIEWGSSCVGRFNGDWAFAIFDVRANVLFCSRDRFGVKPFNYAITGQRFIFSSEIKSIIHFCPELRTPNYNIIANYCRNSLGAQVEQTWFNGVSRLLPAHNLIWKDGRVTVEKYWSYPTETDTTLSVEEAKRAYRSLFERAVQLRMRSDVPVGTSLSSGLDSSSIVSVVARSQETRHKTFTATFSNGDMLRQDKVGYSSDLNVDEGDVVKRLADRLHLDAHFVQVTDDTFVEELSSILYHLESGHSSHAIVPLAKIFECARNHVKVMLDGQGADELLSGYVIRSFPALVKELLKRGEVSRAAQEYGEFRKRYSLSYALQLYVRTWNRRSIEYLFQSLTGIENAFGKQLKRYRRLRDYPLPPPHFEESFNRELFKVHTGGLVNLLHYGDAISLSKSVESRSPFTDVDLVEFSFRLPFYLKMHDGLGKYIHRISMQGVVPDFILQEGYKFGFTAPLSKHFATDTSPANAVLLSNRCLERGVFDVEGLRNLIAAHRKGSLNTSSFLYRALSVELWFRRFLD